MPGLVGAELGSEQGICILRFLTFQFGNIPVLMRYFAIP